MKHLRMFLFMYCFVYIKLSLSCVFAEKLQVVIIGAGASGIAAASKLIENGICGITILEAEDRIGGRIYTDKFGGYLVDLGGQWVHGDKGNPVYDMAWPLGLLEHADKERRFELFNSSGDKFLSEEQTKNITDFFFYVENSPKDFAIKGKIENLGDIFRRALKQYFVYNPELAQYERQILHLFEKITLSIDSAPSWNKLVWNENWGFPGDQSVNWKDKGYSMILDILMKKYPDPSKELQVMEKIKFSTEVIQIDYTESNEKVKVRTKSGETFEADHVIFTPSLGVLKASHETLFSPKLSQQKKHFIENFGYGSVTKIYLQFEHPWWNTSIYATNIVWTDEDKKQRESDPETAWQLFISVIIRVEHKPNLLCIWVVGKGAEQVEILPEDTLMAQIEDLLQIFNKNYKVTLPEQIIRTKWFINTNFRGTYSYYSLEALRNHANVSNFAEPIVNNKNKPIILFAGEATDKRSYSTVHGAIISGWREANRLTKLYQPDT